MGICEYGKLEREWETDYLGIERWYGEAELIIWVTVWEVDMGSWVWNLII